MTVKINYNVSPSKKNLDNQVVFVDDNFNISGLKTHISRNEFSYIYDLININDKKKNIITFDISSKKKIILVSTKKKMKSAEVESLGAKFYDHFKAQIKIFLI